MGEEKSMSGFVKCLWEFIAGNMVGDIVAAFIPLGIIVYYLFPDVGWRYYPYSMSCLLVILISLFFISVWKWRPKPKSSKKGPHWTWTVPALLALALGYASIHAFFSIAHLYIFGGLIIFTGTVGLLIPRQKTVIFLLTLLFIPIILCVGLNAVAKNLPKGSSDCLVLSYSQRGWPHDTYGQIDSDFQKLPVPPPIINNRNGHYAPDFLSRAAENIRTAKGYRTVIWFLYDVSERTLRVFPSSPSQLPDNLSIPTNFEIKRVKESEITAYVENWYLLYMGMWHWTNGESSEADKYFSACMTSQKALSVTESILRQSPTLSYYVLNSSYERNKVFLHRAQADVAQLAYTEVKADADSKECPKVLDLALGKSDHNFRSCLLEEEMLLRVYLYNGNIEEAKAIGRLLDRACQGTLTTENICKNVQRDRAEIFVSEALSGKKQDAVTAIDILQKLDKHRLTFYDRFLLGKAYFAEGRFKEAESEFDKLCTTKAAERDNIVAVQACYWGAVSAWNRSIDSDKKASFEKRLAEILEVTFVHGKPLPLQPLQPSPIVRTPFVSHSPISVTVQLLYFGDAQGISVSIKDSNLDTVKGKCKQISDTGFAQGQEINEGEPSMQLVPYTWRCSVANPEWKTRLDVEASSCHLVVEPQKYFFSIVGTNFLIPVVFVPEGYKVSIVMDEPHEGSYQLMTPIPVKARIDLVDSKGTPSVFPMSNEVSKQLRMCACFELLQDMSRESREMKLRQHSDNRYETDPDWIPAIAGEYEVYVRGGEKAVAEAAVCPPKSCLESQHIILTVVPAPTSTPMVVPFTPTTTPTPTSTAAPVPTPTSTATATPTPTRALTPTHTPAPAPANRCDPSVRIALEAALKSQSRYIEEGDTSGLLATWGDAAGKAEQQGRKIRLYHNNAIQGVEIIDVNWEIQECQMEEVSSTITKVTTKEKWTYKAKLYCRPGGTTHSMRRIETAKNEQYELVYLGNGSWRVNDWKPGEREVIENWECAKSSTVTSLPSSDGLRAWGLQLPLYCSHLNPIEPFWEYLKNAVAASRLQ